MTTSLPYWIIQSKTPRIAAQSTLPVLVVFAGWKFNLLPNVLHEFSPVAMGALFCALMAAGLSMAIIRRKSMLDGTLILGGDDLAAELCHALAKDGSNIGQGELTIGSKELSQLSAKKGISRIIIAASDPTYRQQLTNELIECKLRGVAVEEARAFHEKLTGKIRIQGLSPDWWIYSDGFQPSRVFLWRKRIMDVVCASLMILVTTPILLLVAIGIKLESPGPVIFRQERVGLHGSKFVLYKFRSMRTDAESKSGPVWAREVDDRISAFGKFLRKCHLDEIPQAFNVLRGEMSFFGPRPERPYFVDLLTEKIPYYGLRHYVKPGITGWAQVTYPYGASVEDSREKLQYDLYYIKHMSIAQDMLVLLKTFKMVFFGIGR